MWAPTISSDELYHHGILGMKWGKKNGPPYPLDTEDHSAAEKRAMNLGEKKKGLSDEQKSKIKKVAKGTAVVAGTVIAAYAAYKVGSDPRIQSLAKKGMSYIKGIDTKQQVSNLLKKSGSKIANNVGNKTAGNRGAEMAKKIANYSNKVSGAKDFSSTAKKVANTSSGLGLKYSNNANWQAAHEKIDKSIMDGLKNYHPSERAKYAKTAAEAAKKQHQYLNELEKHAGQYYAQVKAGAKLPNDNINSASDLERLLKSSSSFSNLASNASKQASRSTGQRSYTETLLNKNGGKLKNMSMDDLKKLDLY